MQLIGRAEQYSVHGNFVGRRGGPRVGPKIDSDLVPPVDRTVPGMSDHLAA